LIERKGAKSIALIDKKILKALNRGEIETANLVEGLAIDFNVLASHVGITNEKCTEIGIVKKMKFFGKRIKNWKDFSAHPSDTVRGMAAYALAQSKTPLKVKLESMKTFADDQHFGVREWAWLSIRDELAQKLELSIEILEKWSTSKSENIRRFSSEALRPRGVWCSHIDALKTKPELALHLLENLKADDSKYVQNSVANWLNDVGKTQPGWVKKICAGWKKEKDKNTDCIVKRALRSIGN
jgi:3-methyladenine DNA glycosylase AlkC